MNALFASPLGRLLARPWVDPAGLIAMRRWYFPLSRLWAAANAAGEDVGRFRAEIGAPLPDSWPLSYLSLLLRRNARARVASEMARRRWETAIFGGSDIHDTGVEQLDKRRRWAASRHLATRAIFYPLLFPRRPPAANWDIPDVETIRREFGSLLSRPADLYTVPIDTAPFEVSQAFVRKGLREYWLRMPTPSARLGKWQGSETFYARVVEPVDALPADTLIFGSGLCLEFDLLAVARDPGSRLARLGWRVIEPISPFHGLRAMLDRYGGEPFFGSAPAGTIDLIAGQAIEAAVLIAWCRTRFGGKVALAGISMTSFVAQQVASYCDAWVPASRPDGVMLISHSGRIQQVTFGGKLAGALGLEHALLEVGWTLDTLGSFTGLLDPAAEPALPAHRIVSVLGKTDRWLHYEDGLDVARRWKLPEENVFHYRLGHLGMPVQLTRDAAPFARLRQVLAE